MVFRSRQESFSDSVPIPRLSLGARNHGRIRATVLPFSPLPHARMYRAYFLIYAARAQYDDPDNPSVSGACTPLPIQCSCHLHCSRQMHHQQYVFPRIVDPMNTTSCKPFPRLHTDVEPLRQRSLPGGRPLLMPKPPDGKWTCPLIEAHDHVGAIYWLYLLARLLSCWFQSRPLKRC